MAQPLVQGLSHYKVGPATGRHRRADPRYSNSHPFSSSSGSSISPSVSPEGRWVYVLRVSPDARDHSLLTYDTDKGSFAPKVLRLDGCRPVGLLPSPTERRIHILCNQSHEVRTVDLLASGEPQAVRRLALPNVEDSTEDSFGNDERLGAVSAGALSLEGDLVYAATSNGHVLSLVSLRMSLWNVGGFPWLLARW